MVVISVITLIESLSPHGNFEFKSIDLNTNDPNSKTENVVVENQVWTGNLYQKTTQKTDFFILMCRLKRSFLKNRSVRSRDTTVTSYRIVGRCRKKWKRTWKHWNRRSVRGWRFDTSLSTGTSLSVHSVS